LNRELIKLDQDPLGIQAKRILVQEHIHVYIRPVMPMYKDKASVAVAWLSRWTEGTPLTVSCNLTSLGLDHPQGYLATDLFTGRQFGTFKPEDTFTSSVNPTSILLVKFSILPGSVHNHKSNTVNTINTVNTEREQWLTVTYPGLRNPDIRKGELWTRRADGEHKIGPLSDYPQRIRVCLSCWIQYSLFDCLFVGKYYHFSPHPPLTPLVLNF